MRAGALLRLCSNPGLHYQQGQRPGPGIREYFYYVDHQGQLFLDDTKVKNFVTCFKDVRFLSFFFRHLERNRVGRYQRRFPWVSRCGRERNFLRCSDLPVVFTQLLRGSRGSSLLSYCGGGAELAVPFQPGMLAVLPESRKGLGLANVELGKGFHLSPFFCSGVSEIDGKSPRETQRKGAEITQKYLSEKGKKWLKTHSKQPKKHPKNTQKPL